MVRSLPNGGYAIAQDIGGVFRTITHKPVSQASEQFDGVAHDEIPMLFSGVVTKAILRGTEGLEMLITEQTRKRLSGYGKSASPPKRLQLQRFRIGYHQMVDELAPRISTDAFYTQYVAQRPSWYSGAMAEVMQIVGGFGRQEVEQSPDHPLEHARMSLPPGVHDNIRAQIVNVRLPGYTGRPPKSGQFQYDYKFHNTNAVAFDSDKKPWLVRVSPTGVHVMPLPMIPATTTRAFRKYIEDVEDSEIEEILDRFGGIPSGEGFPGQEKDFQAWRRAGVIIKVCDTADFYEHIAYSSAMGWTFNSRGSEGYNTCYDYYDDEGLGYGLTYKMRLSLGPADNEGRLPQSFHLEDEHEAEDLNAYLSGLYELLDHSAEHLAIRYKIRRVSVDEILARRAGRGQSEVDYWNQLTMPPIAQHSGSVSEVGRGYLYHGATFEFQPQIKFPEPFLGGCVSHDFLPLIHGRYKPSYPNSDTIMFCYFVGDDLKVVKYCRNDGSFFREVETDFETCMTVGSWFRIETTGQTTLHGHFYSSDIDERRVLAPVTETTVVVGKDLGYDHTPHFSFNDFFSMCGTLWRYRYCSHHTTVERTEGERLTVATCVPYLSRNALLHAKKEETTASMRTESAALRSVLDPHSYKYWTYHFIWAWVGCPNAGYPADPFPKDGNPVWLNEHVYTSSTCGEWADSGPWAHPPEPYTWLIHPDPNEWRHSGGGGAPPFRSYSKVTYGEPEKETGDLKISVQDSVGVVHNRVPTIAYFLGSPNLILGVFYRDVSKIEFGQMQYANVSESAVAGGKDRKHWGYSRLADHRSAHHFFGVINE